MVMRLLSVPRGYNTFSSDNMAAATGNVIVIENDSHFLSEMTKAGAKLVVVDFMAVW